MEYNPIVALVKYFSTPEKPVLLKEMREFLESMSEEERDYYRMVDLQTGRLPGA